MKTWYGVTSTFDDEGHATASLTDTVKAAERPQDSYTNKPHKDVYVDWFESLKEAEAYIKKARSV